MNKISFSLFIIFLLLGITALVIFLRSIVMANIRFDYLPMVCILLIFAGIFYKDSKKKDYE
jgi:hypothetical protein